MNSVENRAPTQVTGLAAARVYAQFVRDPLEATIRAHANYGPFVVISDPLPLIKLRRRDALAVGAAFNHEVLTDAVTWRTMRISPGGGDPSGTSVRRLGAGFFSMRGRRHAHYRRLVAPPLSRERIEARGDEMAQLAIEEVESWPLEKEIDLFARAGHLVRNLSIGLLFGDNRERGYPVLEMISRGIDLTWSRFAACPINLPFTPYGKLIRNADRLERCIIDWAESVRGNPARDDLLSIIVNNPDANGKPASTETIVGHMPTLIGGSSETCQNALIWTLILLAQHPTIARDLSEELDGKLAGDAPTPKKVADLPLLNSVIKESMRLLPPFPTQFRVADRDATLAGQKVTRGSCVALSIFLTNREPNLYQEPHRFCPKRWETIAPTSFEYPVFGVGVHGCPGYWFGLSAVKVGLAAILSRYRISLLPQQINYKVLPILSPRGQVRAVLHRQDRESAPTALSGRLTNLVHLATQPN